MARVSNHMEFYFSSFPSASQSRIERGIIRYRTTGVLESLFIPETLSAQCWSNCRKQFKLVSYHFFHELIG